MSNLVKDTSLYTIGNIIPKIVNFFLLPIYTAYVTASDFGIVQSMQILSTILIVFFTLAIDRSIYRLYFDYKTEEDKKTYLSTIVISLLIISVSVLILLFVFNNIISKIYTSIDFYPFYSFAIISTFLSVYAFVPKIYYQINEKAGKFIVLSLLQFFSNAGFVLWFVVFAKQGAVGWLKGLMFGNLVILPVFVLVTIKAINFKFNLTYLKDSLKFSLPIIPSLLSAWILNMSDRIFIERYFSLQEVGVYSLGYKIAGLVLIISSAFNLAYTPVFFKLANSDNQIEAKRRLSKYNLVFIIILILIVFVITFFAKEVLVLFFKPQYFEAYKIIFLISIVYLIGQISGLLNLSISQKKKTIVIMFIVLGSAIINIILNFLLIPIYSIYGAAYATIISYTAFTVVTYFFAKKYYFIPINWYKIFILILSLVIIEYTIYLINIPIYYLIILKVLIIIIVFVSVFLIFKKIILNFKQFK